jgi:hypothetical protein
MTAVEDWERINRAVEESEGMTMLVNYKLAAKEDAPREVKGAPCAAREVYGDPAAKAPFCTRVKRGEKVGVSEKIRVAEGEQPA